MTPTNKCPSTQAELDAYVASWPRPVRNTYEGMFPLHEDIELSDEQIQLVLDYVREVDFHLPGSSAGLGTPDSTSCRNPSRLMPSGSAAPTPAWKTNTPSSGCPGAN